MRSISGIFSCIVGLIIWGVAIAALISWVAFCFGSVIIGVLLLIFAPYLLLAPLAIGKFGTVFLLRGIDKIVNTEENSTFV